MASIENEINLSFISCEIMVLWALNRTSFDDKAIQKIQVRNLIEGKMLQTKDFGIGKDWK